MTITVRTQDVGLDWTKQFEGTEAGESFSIDVDDTGNVYTTGYFQGTVDFDPGNGVFTLTSMGSHDAFISKLDANGNFIWAKQFKGNGSVRGFSIALDNSGNVYTSGLCQGGFVDFDPGPDEFNLFSPDPYPVTYISKLDVNGGFLWANRIWGTDYVTGLSITLDDSSNVYMGGSFKGTVDLNPIDTAAFSITSAGFYDMFILKLNIDGEFKWGAHFGGNGNDYCNSIALDNNANMYSTGSFAGEVDFDPSENEYLINGKTFISKLDLNGGFVLAKAISGSSVTGLSVDVDASENIYYGGVFSGTVDFDPGLELFEIFSSGGINAFVSKLDMNGDFLWAGQMGGAGTDNLPALTLDAEGNIYSTGYFRNTADFDPGDGTYDLIATDMSDIFVSKLNTDGGFVWAKKLGGAGHEEGFSVVVDNSGNVHSCGVFVSSTDFDPGDDLFVLDGGDNGDPYVHKMKALLTGIESSVNSFVVEVSLYPNPNSGVFTIRGEDIQRIELYGIEGKLIETIELKGKSSYQVQLGNETKGLLFAKVITSKDERIIRIAVK